MLSACEGRSVTRPDVCQTLGVALYKSLHGQQRFFTLWQNESPGMKGPALTEDTTRWQPAEGEKDQR